MMSDFYQLFYRTTPEGEKDLVYKLANSSEQVLACKKRLAELEDLLKLDEKRCHSSKVQRDFLRRVLLPYNT